MINVGLIIDAIGSYGRGLLRGIARFVHANPSWAVQYEEWMEGDAVPRWLARGQFHGVLCRMRNPRQFESLRRLKVPIVDLGSLPPPPDIANIHSDHAAISRMAAAHLLACELPNLAYCGFEGQLASAHRMRAFQDYLAGHGIRPAVFQAAVPMRMRSPIKPKAPAEPYDSALAAWLDRVPKPVGIMACNDLCGRRILAVCQRKGLCVPEQVAVIGVDNDEVLCALAIPALSSVDPGADRIGFGAAELLDRLIKGDQVPPAPLLVAPLEVLTRTSTDTIAVGDSMVVAALRYIRTEAGVPTIEDILAHLDSHRILVSRSTLERRFKMLLGFLPHDEIIRVRVNRIEKLLRSTEFPLWRIAKMAGLADEPHLNRFFRSHRGISPGEFRRRITPQIA